ncbi:MAG: EI24 domain-containing protein [Bdellovibrionales bacterium]
MNSVSLFFLGIRAPFEGFRLLSKHRPLKLLAAIPVVIALVTLVVSLSLGWSMIPELMTSILPATDGGVGGFLIWLVVVLAGIVYAAALLAFVMLIANIIAIPFNGMLSEKLFQLEGEKFKQIGSTKEWISFTGHMVLVGLAKALIFLCFSIAIVLFSFIPFLSIPLAAISFSFLAFDCSDYGLELKDYGLRKRLGFFRSNYPSYFGFGLMIGLSFLLPGLNFFLLPAYICGGAWMVTAIEKQKLLDSKL